MTYNITLILPNSVYNYRMTYPMDQRLLKLKKKMKMYRSQTVHFWNKRKKIVRYYKTVCVLWTSTFYAEIYQKYKFKSDSNVDLWIFI